MSQKGAREHFLAARALNRQGHLARLIVDWYGPSPASSRRFLALFPGGRTLSALAARAEGVPDSVVSPLRLLGLWYKWKERVAIRRGSVYDGYLKTDTSFARTVARLNLPAHDVFFGYSYASLEALEAEKQRGCLVIVCQIDPGPVHFRLVAEEMAKYREFAGPPPAFPTAYYARARREWELADLIVVNSEWSRDAITAEGADSTKIEVLPLAYEADPKAEKRDQRAVSQGPLKVLWLGQVNVGKGIHYLLDAIRLLEQEPVELQIAGRLGIRPEAIANAPKNVSWLGPLPRSKVSTLYGASEVFVLPTLSDGFALTQLEAMAHGLPVIITPNCGRVVEHGVTGFVVPPRDPRALAGAIMRFVRNRCLAAEMSPRCIQRAKAFSIDEYGQRLVKLLEQRIERRDREVGPQKPEVRGPAIGGPVVY